MSIFCKGCSEMKPGVKSHIIPESFFRDARIGSKPLKKVTNTKGVPSKRAPKGEYDKEILCAECEEKFKDLDNYASKLLLQIRPLEKISDGFDIHFYRIKNADYKTIKLFFISILWRASVSKQDFFKRVSLGEKLEKQAKKMIWEQNSGSEDDFSFVLAKFTNGDPLSKIIHDPFQERWYNINYYRFYLSDYVLYIKASSRPTPHQFRKFIPKDENWYIVARDIRKSPELNISLEATLNL